MGLRIRGVRYDGHVTHQCHGLKVTSGFGGGTFILCCIVAVVGLFTSCSSNTSGFPAEAVLAPGATVAVKGEAVTASFAAVVQDSRCSTDVVCIHAGEAIVELTLRSGNDTERLLITIPRGAPATASALGLRVDVLELQPLPVSTQSIDRGDYRLRVRLSPR